MTMGRANFGNELYPGIKTRYGLAYKRYPEEYLKLFPRVENSTRAYEESISLTGFGMAVVKEEGESVSYATAKENWKGRITHVTYGLGFKVTEEMYSDDQTKVINMLPDALARSVQVTKEVIGANVFNNAFTGGPTGADGLSLCNASHLLGGGGTWRNQLSVAADLSETSLEQALIDIGDFTDDRGLPIMARGTKLLIAQENEWLAMKLTKSEKEYDTNNNAINPARGIMPYEVNHFFTDPDAWFIQTDVPDGLVWYWRKKDSGIQKDGDFDAEVAKFKVTFRASCGWDDPRGIFGSPGA